MKRRHRVQLGDAAPPPAHRRAAQQQAPSVQHAVELESEVRTTTPHAAPRSFWALHPTAAASPPLCSLSASWLK
jgi:hypothetical protein